MKSMSEQFKTLSCRHSTGDTTLETPHQIVLAERFNRKLIDLSEMLIDSEPLTIMWVAAFHSAAKSVNPIIRAEKTPVGLRRGSNPTFSTNKKLFRMYSIHTKEIGASTNLNSRNCNEFWLLLYWGQQTPVVKF